MQVEKSEELKLGKQQSHMLPILYKFIIFSIIFFNILRYGINVKRTIFACDSGGYFLLEQILRNLKGLAFWKDIFTLWTVAVCG